MRNKSFLRVQMAADVKNFLESGGSVKKLPPRGFPRKKAESAAKADMSKLPTQLKLKFGIK